MCPSMSAMMAPTWATLRTFTASRALLSAETAQLKGPQLLTYWSQGKCRLVSTSATSSQLVLVASL